MKRLIIALAIIAMLGAIYPGLPTIAQTYHLPHENPDTATGLLDEAGLLLSYSQIINLAAYSQYRNAHDILNELEHADFPDEIRYIAEQYSNLCERLFSLLSNLETRLDEATDLLARNQIEGVRQRLDSAEADIRNAYILLKDIQVATDSLSEKFGVFMVSATEPLTQAHARLEESIKRLADLVDRLNSLNRGLTEQYVQKTRLSPTGLNLSIDPASAYVGDDVTASGRLSKDGIPLAGKRLSLTLDNNTVATAVTGLDGTYVTGITLPYKYVESMTFTAAYEPAGNDADIYLGSKSPPVTITTMFYQTTLEVSSPKTVYRGLPFTLSGAVASNDDNISRNIKVLLNDQQLAEEAASGKFSLEITPPEKAPPGAGNLTVAVSPQGRYSGASEHRGITISVLPIHVDIQTPSMALLPGDVRISGIAYSELGPVTDARVNLNLGDASVTTRTSADGSFAGVIKLHLMPGGAPIAANPFYVSATPADSFFDFSPIGTHEIEITVEPPASWATAASVKRQISTVNPLSTVMIVAIFAALWLVVRRRSHARIPEEKRLPPAETVEIPAITPTPAPGPKPTGIKGRILSAYRSGLAAVERITGVIMAPDSTLREFLTIARMPSPPARERFAELTAITESTLYSVQSPQQETATRAEELATNIKEELHSGTP